jgi:hypothetical protein
LGVSRWGEFKNATDIFFVKSQCRKRFENNRQTLQCQFFLDFFVLSHFRVFRKTTVSKSFYKRIDKNPKPIFFDFVFYHDFGCFSVRRVEKDDKNNIEKINLTLAEGPWSFFGL